MPNSHRIYVEGEIHPDIRVPFREIALAPTKDFNGNLEPNEPVRVYEPAARGATPINLPIRRKVFRQCESIGSAGEGMSPSRPRPHRSSRSDDGYLTEGHRESDWARRNPQSELRDPQFQKRKPLRASAGHPVTQLWYARQGIITPEMEFIAIRENGRQMRNAERGARNGKQVEGI